MPENVNINVQLEDLKTVTCECGGEHFIQIITYKILPALYSAAGQEQIVAVPNFVKCSSCGKVQRVDLLTKEFKEKEDRKTIESKIVLVK